VADAVRRVAGVVIVLAGVAGTVAVPALGLPGAFPVLMLAALVLWFTGVGTAAGCVVPARPRAGVSALVAAVMAWPLIVLHGQAVLWGAVATGCGLVVALDRGRPGRRVTGPRADRGVTTGAPPPV